MASDVVSSVLDPIARGVASSLFTHNGQPGMPDPRQQRDPAQAFTPAPVQRFPYQANPNTMQFGDPDDPVQPVFLNAVPATEGEKDISSAFFKLNPNTVSVVGAGGASLMFSDSLIESKQKAGELESILRGSCIDAIMGMKSLNLAEQPAAMSVMLARGPQGWQFWTHSSIKVKTGEKSSGQARQAPALERVMENAAYKHHFNGMCAEMAVLTDYLTEYPNAVDANGRFTSPAYILTYNTDILGSGDDGTGRYLKPCSHNSSDTCVFRGQQRPGIVGCTDVLRLLGVNVIGKGKPSEQDVRILVDQGMLPPSALKRFGPPANPAAAGAAATATPPPGQTSNLPVSSTHNPSLAPRGPSTQSSQQGPAQGRAPSPSPSPRPAGPGPVRESYAAAVTAGGAAVTNPRTPRTTTAAAAAQGGGR